MEEGTDEEKKQAARALQHIVCEEGASGKAYIPDQMATRLIEYLRSGVNGQNAGVAAALSTLATVREGVVPLFQRFTQPNIDEQKLKSRPDAASKDTNTQNGILGFRSIADAW
ncbi:unnamed protein product [Phytophthora lilii]|uniref:Unnamed protein product n=1 Tax=Phytophthora lilii TaxID=2077276 RepID=A0A9W6XM13_9STRA|nr:unnamed protein product [Phytophthora lilii]